MAKQILALIILAVVLSSCASQIAPSGGEKDLVPPMPVRSSPENLSIHFEAEKINIVFDEFIQTGDFNSQVFFSPALSQRPLFRVHGKMLTITLKDTLLPKTTYTVNFGNAVKDITEGNVMINYQYVFSTGDYIDSMRIQGIVRGAEDAQAKENILAMLYNDVTDSVVIKERPSYYAHTNKAGQFEISHLKEGIYKLIALNDKSADLKYTPGEEIAFLDSSIAIRDSAGFYTLTLFKPIAEQQKVLGASSTQPGRVMIAFAKRLNALQLTPLNGLAGDAALQFSNARDTAFYYLNDVTTDSIRLQVTDGKPYPSRLARWLPLMTGLVVVAGIFYLFGYYKPDSPGNIPNLLYIPSLRGTGLMIYLVAYLAVMTIALVPLLLRYRAGDERLRRRDARWQ